MRRVLLATVAVAGLALASCGPKKDEAAQAPAGAATATAAQDAAPAPATETATPAAAGFDINKYPISTAALGEWPYFGVPDGYREHRGQNLDFARFPFWVGDHFEWVEGKLHQGVFLANDGKTFSQLEVMKNVEALVAQAGGTKVYEGQLPRDAWEGLDANVKREYEDGLSQIHRYPLASYVIRRDGANIWVQTDGRGWAIVQSGEFKATSNLLPQDELKKQIDALGKATVQINFAVDKSDILPDSQPQVEQIAQLLLKNDGLKLSVEGHTDNTGSPAHNKTLSEQRAKSVVAALTAKGVAASRLRAKGFGQDKPVADNTTDEGKAKNRRVELVKM